MKKLSFFACFFGVFFFQGKAQENWLCVYPIKKVYFEDVSKYVHTIRIDSTFNDNTILYPFSDLHEIEEHCYSITSGSWLSKYIVIDENGNTFFVNGDNQQIFIKSQAALNESWSVFENGNIKIKGQITSAELKSVLGVEDSVKIISFSVFDINDTPINHRLNQSSIEVSKHLGLVKTISFYSLKPTNSNQYIGEFNLIGINEPQLGFQNLNLKEQYFDFQVDDELHIWQTSRIPISDTEIYNNKIVHRYLSRTDYEDRIEYSYERKINSNIPKDTLEQVIIKGELLFETEPNEPFTDDFYIFKAMIKNSLVLEMSIARFYWIYYNPDDPCFESTAVDLCPRIPNYLIGLGGPYYELCAMWYEEYRYELVYYRKGDVEVGVPFDFEASVSESKEDISFSVYPNPASDYITIKFAEISDNSIVEIYDIHGKKCLSKYLDNSGLIDVSKLQSGLYCIIVYDKNKKVYSQKFIKR